jgi:tRNA-dihydrouridine synthase B
MVGLSHVSFRRLVRSYTPSSARALLFTEMLSTRKIPNERLETTNELKTAPGETHFVPQLLGNEEKYIAPSVAKLLTLNPFGFDINMGCPVAHTLKHNWGVRLMGDTAYAAEVVRICKRASPLPVSVKLRGGNGEVEDLDFLLKFTEALESAGVDWLTVHPRPRAQRHKGDANWELVQAVRRARSVPVVGNGNVQNADDALATYEAFESDGVMIARAATARPWILWQIARRLGLFEAPPGREGQRCPETPEEEGREYVQACLKHLEFMQEDFPCEVDILDKFRFFAATGARWFQFGHSFWKMTTKAKSVAQLRDGIVDFGERCENPMEKTVKHL